MTMFPSLPAVGVGSPASRYSVLVVGGGLAGLEVAKELQNRGVPRVLLLEAGPAHDLRHVNFAHEADTALRMWLTPEVDEYFRQPWSSANPPSYTGSSGIRQRLGGRSLYWYGVSLPIEDAVLDDPLWPRAVVRDLRDSWRGGAGLYAVLHRQLRTWAGAEDPTAGAGSGRRSWHLGPYELHRTPRPLRHSSSRPGRWSAYSALDHWSSPSTAEPLVSIRTDATVSRLLADDRRVHGVLVRNPLTNSEVPVFADHVVLAAGTIPSTQLAARALHAAGAIDRPRLSGLSDHLVQGVFARFAPAHATRLLDRVEPGSYFAPCFAEARSNLFLDIRLEDDGSVLVDLQMTGEQLPAKRNYIEAAGADDDARSSIVHATTTAADDAVLDAQRSILQSTWEQLSALVGGPCRRHLEFADFTAPQRTNTSVLPETIRALPWGEPSTWSGYLGTEDHEGCTLPLGSVLTEDHEFAALGQLFAAGPAIFPRMGAANPSLTTLALAHRLAAILADRVL